MNLIKTAAASTALGVALLGFTVPDANAVSSYVKNVGTRRLTVDDSCRSTFVLDPGRVVNLRCSGRRVLVPGTDCVRIKNIGYAANLVCAGSSSTWHSFRWTLDTTLEWSN